MSPLLASVQVGTADLRAALRSVKVHTCPDDTLPALTRVRLTLQPDNLYVTATDRYTAGMAIVSIWDDHAGTGEVTEVDLSGTDVVEILTLFKGKKTDEDAGMDALRLDVTASEFVVTDVTGLFASDKQLRLPRNPPEKFPSIPKLLSGAIGKARALRSAAADAGTVAASVVDEVCANGVFLARFKAASEAYKEPLVVQQTAEARAALLVACGESFVGLIMPVTPEESAMTRIRAWQAAWLRRLPEPDEAPVAMPEPVEKDTDGDEGPGEDAGREPGPGQVDAFDGVTIDVELADVTGSPRPGDVVTAIRKPRTRKEAPVPVGFSSSGDQT